jgi:hypothetical protein
METLEDITAIVYDEFEEEEEIEKKPFEVDNPQKADWCITKIAEAQRRKKQREALVKHYKEKLDRWLAETNRPDEDNIEFFESLLRPFVQEEVKKNGKKSVNFPAGRAGFRTSTRTIVEDEESLLAWAEENAPEAVKKSLLKSKLPDGAPGVVHEQNVSFNVQPNQELLEG